MNCIAILLGAAMCAWAQPPADPGAELLHVKRVYVDRLTGGETAAQMRDLIIASLQGARLFVLTENPERADATLKGAAEDLIYTDTLQTSERDSLRASMGIGGLSSKSATARRASAGDSESESVNIRERKHEALATVRLVNKDGDVIWSTTQESNGAKFRGASADVADKITRQLATEFERQRKSKP
jgi:hypothetical protein